MVQKSSLMGTSGSSGSKKKKKPNPSGSLLKPINSPPKLTAEQMGLNSAKASSPTYKEKAGNVGPTIENAKKLTNNNNTKKSSTPSSSGGVSVSSGGGGGSGGRGTTSSKSQDSYEKEFRAKYEKQIQNELDRYEKQLRDELKRNEKGINDEIARLEASGRATIDRNNEYLAQQIAQLQDQKVMADQETINLMNRRGAFYSGGTDYFLSQNQRATQEATGNLQSEIGSRNAEIEQGNQLARERALSQITMSREQAMSTLNMMREQAPDKVRQLVDEALERQWAKDFQIEQFNFQKQQAAAAAARASASQALSAQRFQAQQAQQAWENQMAEKQWEWQKQNANAGTGQQQDNSVGYYNQFLMDLPRLESQQEGYALIKAYQDRGVSQETVTQMIKDLNNRYGY